MNTRILAKILLGAARCLIDKNQTISLGQNLLANAFIISAIPPEKINGTVFYLAKDNLELKRFSKLHQSCQKISGLAAVELYVWPEGQDLPARRLWQLFNNRPLIIATVTDNLQQKIISRDSFGQSLIELRAGQKINRDDLIERLAKIGYEFNTQADQPGLFSKRGEVLDIWNISCDQPVRLEFDFQTIGSLRHFDPTTKQPGKNLKEIIIAPQKIDSGGKTSLANYIFPDKLIIKADEYASEAPIAIQQTPKFSNQLNNFIAEIKKYLQEGWQIYFLNHEKNSLSRLLRENNLTELDGQTIALKNQLPEVTYGFKLSSEKLLVLTDFDIFGYQFLKPEKQQKKHQIFLPPLEVGSYVVHLNHGIARLAEITKITLEGITREYFVLNYAGNDRLYVPVDQAEKLEKYLGAGKPAIHSLGRSSTWPQIVKKIKEDTVKTAHELLNIYANRQLADSRAFQDFPEEKELADSFPYEETAGQLKTLEEVFNDLKKSHPADRLVCGDVGFGKTEIAVRAALKAALNGWQTALLCPTTILAQQHEDTFRQRLKKFNVNISSLSRFQSPKEQKEIIAGLKNGRLDIIIGTHRLLSHDVSFKNLGLIIIDEEQRFGVKHKEQLKKIKARAHVLTLTATPIPRTLNLSLSGVRDISIIETPPPGRLPIITEIRPKDESFIKTALNQELSRKGQVYYLYNDVETIGSAVKNLQKLLPDARIDLAHGQLPEKKLAEVMHRFDLGEIDILVCSTIIENGLDLPNVNTLIVENSANFGLAQLYQLRGRIGRGDRQAYAYFLYSSQKLPGKAGDRLKALEEAAELGAGFQLAMRDMEIRGVGNILGKEQHGKVSAIGLSLYQRLLEQTIEEIKTGIAQEPIPEIKIELPVAYGISAKLEPNQQKRLWHYQKLSGCESIDELEEYFDKLTEKWSRTVADWQGSTEKKQAENLFKLLEFKLLAQKTDVREIGSTTTKDIQGNSQTRIFMTFAKSLDYGKFAELLERQPYWQDVQNKIRIDQDKLSNNWLEKLKIVLTIFKK